MAADVLITLYRMAGCLYDCEVCRHRPPNDSGADSGVLQRASDVAASRAVCRERLHYPAPCAFGSLNFGP